MTLQYVTLTLDLYDGQGNPLTKGTATFTPSAQLTDTTDHELITQLPIVASFQVSGSLPTVKLLATDNGVLAPSGWGWSVTFAGMANPPAAFSFFLPHSGGASQNLSALTPLSSVPAAYLPLRLIYADLYGADPTGAADSTAAIVAAQAAGGTGAWQIVLSAGTYVLGTSTDIGAFGRNQGMTGQGRGVTAISYHGSGTCIAAFDSSFSAPVSTGGKFGGFSIDGTSAGSAAIGMSWGNLNMARCNDISVANFTGATAVGIQFKNGAGAWSEDAEWTAIKLSGNTVNVLFDSNSFDYSLYQFVIQANANQDGIRLQNNAALEGVRLELRGNFSAGATNTGAVIAIDRGNGSGTSRLDGAQIYVNVEGDGTTGVGHFTLLMQGGSASQFTGTGVLQFNNEAGNTPFQGASLTVNTQQFAFSGRVIDSVLGTMLADSHTFIGGTQWNEHNTLATAFGGTIFLKYGDIFALKLASGSNSLAFSGTLAALARRIELFIAQPASGGAGTISWPSNVWFPGGLPALSTVHGAVDRVRLTYLPAEGNWYGELVTGYVANGSANAPAPVQAAPAGFTPSNPSGTSSTSLVMMGLGDSGSQASPVSYTAAGSGLVQVNVTGYATTATGVSQIGVAPRYGTGTAPVNGAAVTGTVFGTLTAPQVKGVSVGLYVAFAFTGLLTLTPGTPYWLDLALATGSGSNAASVANVAMTLAELPS